MFSLGFHVLLLALLPYLQQLLRCLRQLQHCGVGWFSGTDISNCCSGTKQQQQAGIVAVIVAAVSAVAYAAERVQFSSPRKLLFPTNSTLVPVTRLFSV